MVQWDAGKVGGGETQSLKYYAEDSTWKQRDISKVVEVDETYFTKATLVTSVGNELEGRE